jgi:hypothetical protein
MPAQPTEIRLLVPHDAIVLPNARLGFEGCTLETAGPDRIARAAAELTLAGSVWWGDSEIDFYHTQHSGTLNLPDPKPNTVNVVSKLTILAALREGRPIHDLLFLYGDRRKPDGQFMGVKGLGQVVPQDRPTDKPPALLSGRMAYNICNACPYAAVRFSRDTPDEVVTGTPPYAKLGIPPPHKRLTVTYRDALNRELTATLGLPVYQAKVTGVANSQSIPERPDVLRIVNPNVVVALGAESVAKGLVVFTREVRSSDKGTLLGGRALGMFDSSILLGPRA